MLNMNPRIWLSAFALSSYCIQGFSPQLHESTRARGSELFMDRRSAIRNGMAAAFLIGTPAAWAEPSGPPEVRGTAVTPFNGLAFQYRAGSESSSLKASEIDEPSVPYMEFLDKLSAGEVEFVEFMAPAGDAAYVTFKGKDSGIRIGEGYPVEDPSGWSSPTFVVRAVKNKGVPYKFTVPALKKYQ